MISIDRIDQLEKLERLEKEWNFLLEQCPERESFQTHEWVTTWWKYFGKGNDLWILLLKEDNQLLGIAPLMRVSKRYNGISVRQLQFPNNGCSLRSNFIAPGRSHEIFSAFAQYLKGHSREWDVLILDGISEKSQHYQHLCIALGESGLSRTRDDIIYEVSYIPWEGDWEGFLNTRSKKFRKNIRLTMNRLKALEGVEIVRMANPENIESAVNEVLKIELRSWKIRHGEVVLHQPGYQDFFVEILKHYSGQGGSEAILLKYGDRTIGGLFGIIYKGTFYGLKMSYDEEFGSLSPGLLLFKHLLDVASERNIRSIDLGKSTPFFAKWTDSSRRHYKIIVFNERIGSRLLKYGHQIRSFLSSRLRSTTASITLHNPPSPPF